MCPPTAYCAKAKGGASPVVERVAGFCASVPPRVFGDPLVSRDVRSTTTIPPRISTIRVTGPPRLARPFARIVAVACLRRQVGSGGGCGPSRPPPCRACALALVAVSGFVRVAGRTLIYKCAFLFEACASIVTRGLLRDAVGSACCFASAVTVAAVVITTS